MSSERYSHETVIPAAGRWLSYLLKCIVIVSALLGVFLSARAGRRVFMGGNRVFMYFTIQSNIAVAVISAVCAVRMIREGCMKRYEFILQYVGAVAITLTGVVFCFILAPVLGPRAWNLQNVLTHVVVPVAAVLDFFVTGIYADLKLRCVFFALLPPLAYAVYAGIGYAAGWEFSRGVNYPYFFLNWGSPAGAFGFTRGLPYMGCVWWILAILLFLLIIGILYLVFVGWLRRFVRK